jgi:hypothetical protein
MDKTMEAILTFAGTAGGSAFLLYLFKGAGKWLSGAAHREQVKNTSLATQRAKAIQERDDAEAERDAADVRRREAEEHVAMLQRQVILLGAEPVERNKINQ